MIFHQTVLPGVLLLDVERHSDERGFFARTYCRQEFREQGIAGGIVQANLSYNRLKGTFRGMHYQRAPDGEAKLVSCVAGAIHDIVLDVRPDSDSYGQWLAFELTADNRRALYIPEGYAHGFQTLADDTSVSYQMFNDYAPQSATGVRWDDPAFSIELPLPISVMSDKDMAYPFVAPGDA